MRRESLHIPGYHPSQKALDVLDTLVQGVESIHISAAMELPDEDLKSQASYWQTKFSEKLHSLEGAETPYFHVLQPLIVNGHNMGKRATIIELKRQGLNREQIGTFMQIRDRYLQAAALNTKRP